MPTESVASCRRRRVPPASSPSCTPRNATRVAYRTGTPCAPRAMPGEICAGSQWAPSCAGIGGPEGRDRGSAPRSGAPPAMLGALGDDDFGRQRRADLDAEGIDTRSVARRTTAASGVALIVVEEETGQNRISYV